MVQDITLRFADDAEQRLAALIQKTEASGPAEVIKNALRLYEGMIAATEEGKRWIVKNADGSLQPFHPWQ